jgi:hypothetical protein
VTAKQKAESVGQDAALPAKNLLPRIVAGRVQRAPFDGTPDGSGCMDAPPFRGVQHLADMHGPRTPAPPGRPGATSAHLVSIRSLS